MRCSICGAIIPPSHSRIRASGDVVCIHCFDQEQDRIILNNQVDHYDVEGRWENGSNNWWIKGNTIFSR